MKKTSEDHHQDPALKKKNKCKYPEETLALQELQKRYCESLGITNTHLEQAHTKKLMNTPVALSKKFKHKEQRLDAENPITIPISPDSILSTATSDQIVEEKDVRTSNIWGTIGDNPQQNKVQESDQGSQEINKALANKLNL